tara:strand:+ start:77 stop:421 length:345 start_codon:yes stop_codon:yes gene_type:complete
MAKKEKNIIEKKWMTIKSKSKEDNYDLEELDNLTCDLIAHLAQLTDRGTTEIDDVPLDMYKDRVWWVVEKIGLLPEYRDEDDDVPCDIKDEWEDYEDELLEEIDDDGFYQEIEE